MSMLLTAKAMELQVGNPIRKLVLLKLADQANDKGECWPSYASIAKAAECGRRVVISHIDWLEKHGFLRIEKRAIDKGQNLTNVYHLTLEKGGASNALGGASNALGGASNALGGASNALGGGAPNAPEPVNKNQSMNQSMNHSNAHAEACAADAGVTPSEKPTAKPKPKSRRADDLSLLAEVGVSSQTAEDFLTIRKAKRMPLTKTALQQMAAEAAKAGLTVEQALVFAIGNGWASFRAEWLQNRLQQGRGGKPLENHFSEERFRRADYGDEVTQDF